VFYNPEFYTISYWDNANVHAQRAYVTKASAANLARKIERLQAAGNIIKGVEVSN